MFWQFYDKFGGQSADLFVMAVQNLDVVFAFSFFLHFKWFVV